MKSGNNWTEMVCMQWIIRSVWGREACTLEGYEWQLNCIKNVIVWRWMGLNMKVWDVLNEADFQSVPWPNENWMCQTQQTDETAWIRVSYHFVGAEFQYMYISSKIPNKWELKSLERNDYIELYNRWKNVQFNEFQFQYSWSVLNRHLKRTALEKQ